MSYMISYISGILLYSVATNYQDFLLAAKQQAIL